MRGLRWLVKHQNDADGSWSTAGAAMTGFAILSFLGHGETPTSAEFAPVQKASIGLSRTAREFEGKMAMTRTAGVAMAASMRTPSLPTPSANITR